MSSFSWGRGVFAPIDDVAADALLTAVSVMGDEKGMELIESISDVEAILIPHGEKPVFEKTSEADQYIK